MNAMDHDGLTLMWLQLGGCGGCSMAFLGAEDPGLDDLRAAGIDILWHPSLSLANGRDFHALLDAIESGGRRLDILCVEGAVVTGPAGTGRFHLLSGGDGRSMADVAKSLAGRARFVLAMGSCAAFGGITAAAPEYLEATGLMFDGATPGGALGAHFVSAGGLPVINIAGCAPHPGWMTETLLALAAGELDIAGLDDLNRPLDIFAHLAHHGCGRNEFYEYKASAAALGQQGCLMENLGCKGTRTAGDCNLREWNGGGGCIAGGYSCIACTSPEFERPGHAFLETPKIAGIPCGLPTDMPKAWFVALASLSKAATPRRLRVNAASDRIRALPCPSGTTEEEDGK